MKTTVYSPESKVRNPLALIIDIFEGFWGGRELAKRLFIRNLKATYRQSILGILWAFLPPLVTTFVWVFLNDQKVFTVEETSVPYPLFVMCGTLLWQVFIEGINAPLRVVNQSRSMLIKINFPREALILTAFYETIFNFLIKAIMLVGMFAWFQAWPTLTAFYAIIGILVMLLFSLGIGIVVTPISMLYGDIQRLIGMGMQFLFFLTPIIYPVPKEGIASMLNKINPLSPLITVTRDWLTTGQVEDLGGFYWVSGGSIILFLFALILYKLALPHLIERMGS